MRQWLVLIVFLSSGILQMLCCCAMATTEASCHSTSEVEVITESCCSAEAPEPELKRDCACQDHRLETGNGVLLHKIETANVVFTAPIPPQINPAEHNIASFYVGVSQMQGHGPPPDPAVLCRFLN